MYQHAVPFSQPQAVFMRGCQQCKQFPQPQTQYVVVAPNQMPSYQLHSQATPAPVTPDGSFQIAQQQPQHQQQLPAGQQQAASQRKRVAIKLVDPDTGKDVLSEINANKKKDSPAMKSTNPYSVHSATSTKQEPVQNKKIAAQFAAQVAAAAASTTTVTTTVTSGGAY